MSERSDAQARLVHVLLGCPQGHCWEEELSLETFRSSIFVQRRPELEPLAPPVSPPPKARRARTRPRAPGRS